MPVKVPSGLPAIEALEKEGVFVMTESRAAVQDIRPIKIAVLNLMPNKPDTERQLLRLIANTPLQTEVVFLRTGSYQPKNTDQEHLSAFYQTIDDVTTRNMKFDGLIVTGAPVEKLDFSDVAYWNELQRVFEWATHNVYSSLYICWAAQAALFYHYGIGKTELQQKIFGIFSHRVCQPQSPLVRGFDEVFSAPHSRHTQVDEDKLRHSADLVVLAESDEAGVHLAASKDLRRVFVFGHGEYDRETLHNEYVRDLENHKRNPEKYPLPNPPQNYYREGSALPFLSWRAHGALLVFNWLNYCVYQSTPYNIEDIQ